MQKKRALTQRTILWLLLVCLAILGIVILRIL